MSTSSSQVLSAAPAAGRGRALVVSLTMFALFLAAMDSTVVGTLLPFIKAQLHDDALYPWLMSGFILSSVVATPLAGKLADIVGEKLAMQVALALFLLGSVAVWLAPSMATLVWARALQGVGAGAVSVLAYVVIGRLYSDAERGKMQGVLSLVWGLAAILGPLLGALVHQRWGWRMVFVANVPLCAAIMVLLAARYPAQRAKGSNGAALDALSLLSFAGLLGGALLLIMAPSLQLSALQQQLLIAATVACLALQVWRVRGDRERSLIPVVFLSERRYVLPALLTVIASIALYASVTLLPLYLSGNGATSAGEPVQGGLLVMTAALGWVVGSALCGGLLGKLCYRQAGTIGALALLVGTLLLLRSSATSPVLLFAAAQALVGLGIGFTATTTLVLVQNQAPLARIGSMTAAVHLCRNIGAAVGINTVAALQIAGWRGHGVAASAAAWSQSFRGSFVLLAALTLLAVFLALWLPVRAQRQD